MLPHVPDSEFNDCVNGSDDDGAKMVATSRSFHTQMNSSTAKDARAGAASGRIIRKKICPCPAPSTRAASMTSLGISAMKLCSRNTASGRAKIVCAIHTVAKLCSMSRSAKPGNTVTSPIVRPRENRLNSGTRAICSGTICSANTAMKAKLRPLKSIQANAYARSDATASAKNTTGIVIASEFRNDWPSVSAVPPEFSASE